MDPHPRALARFAVGLTMCLALFSPITARADEQHPCQDDIKKLCPDAKPGPEIRKCLVDNLDKLSDGCRQRVSAVRARRQGYPARFRGCEGDLEKFCKDTMPGAGRLIQCLREHENDLTPDCKSRLPGSRAQSGNGGGSGAGGGKGKGTGSGKGDGSGGGSGQGSASAPTPAKATTDAK